MASADTWPSGRWKFLTRHYAQLCCTAATSNGRYGKMSYGNGNQPSLWRTASFICWNSRTSASHTGLVAPHNTRMSRSTVDPCTTRRRRTTAGKAGCPWGDKVPNGMVGPVLCHQPSALLAEYHVRPCPQGRQRLCRRSVTELVGGFRDGRGLLSPGVCGGDQCGAGEQEGTHK